MTLLLCIYVKQIWTFNAWRNNLGLSAVLTAKGVVNPVLVANMALAVEAGSLSSITEIAGNPPRYPQNPTEVIKESLVLYIARVPGSQGILLSHMFSIVC